MAKVTEEMENKALATPLGRAFKRLFTDPKFVDAVIEDPKKATAEYGLDAEQAKALQSDAYALEGEVSGFAVRSISKIGLLDITGGMRTPTAIGMPRGHGWIGCLTCT